MNLIFFLCCAMTKVCFALSWQDILASYEDLLQPQENLIYEQYEAFVSDAAPSIADPKIRAISIEECDEVLVDLKAMQNERIEMLADPETPFQDPVHHSGFSNASKMRLSVFKKLQQMILFLDELAVFFGYQPGQIHIKVFEGLRDLKTQKALFQKKIEEIQKAMPYLTLEEVYKETAKWVSPVENHVPVHSTGAAVDIRLWDDAKKEFLDLGLFGVIWGSNLHAPTFSEGISDVQKRNRLYCLLAATKAGLTNYVYEYWHFSYGDRYDSYWREKVPDGRKALYGPIEF